ncbi:MAG: HepT-like ribonuclease domain-containing protein [Actinomycetes bacterium]
MLPEADATRLRHMLDASLEAIELAAERDGSQLENDRTASLAIVRLVEIVGEAAAKVSADTRSGLPEVPWREMLDMRNRVIHAYMDVDLDIVAATIRDDLPPLADTLRRVLQEDRA